MSAVYKIEEKQKLQKGLYYIGDPCYIIPDEEWADALDSTRLFNLFKDDSQQDYNLKEDQHGVFSRDGVLFAASSTAYGDGFYSLSGPGIKGVRCAVDAGLLAAIPLYGVTLKQQQEAYALQSRGLAAVVQMKGRFTIGYKNGRVRFGSYSLNTGSE